MTSPDTGLPVRPGDLGELGCTRDGYRLIGTAALVFLLSCVLFLNHAGLGGSPTPFIESVGWLSMVLWVIGIAALARPVNGPLSNWVRVGVVALLLWEVLNSAGEQYGALGWGVLAAGSTWFCWKHGNRLLAFAWAVPCVFLSLQYGTDLLSFEGGVSPLLGIFAAAVGMLSLILPWWTGAWLTRRIRQNQPSVPSVRARLP